MEYACPFEIIQISCFSTHPIIYMVSPKMTPQWQIGYMVKFPEKSRDVLCAPSLVIIVQLRIIGLLNPAIHGIRGASVIEFSVWSLWVLCIYVCYKFSNSLQHNIRPLSRNCNPCATEFVAGVNLRRHDTLRWTVMNVMTIFLWEWS